MKRDQEIIALFFSLPLIVGAVAIFATFLAPLLNVDRKNLTFGLMFVAVIAFGFLLRKLFSRKGTK